MSLSKRALLWCLCIAWFILLVVLSSQDGAATARTSMIATDLIVNILNLPSSAISLVDWLLRFIAHFVCFFVLGITAALATKNTWHNRKAMIVLSAVLVLVAVLDEVKKLMVIGRHLDWPEVGLNVASLLLGILIIEILSLFTPVTENTKK